MKLTDEKREQLLKIIESANPIMIFAVLPSLDKNSEYKQQIFAGGEGSDANLIMMFAELMGKDERICKLFHEAVIKHTEDKNPGARDAVGKLIDNVIKDISVFNKTPDKKDWN